jgi:hypothetical protein
MEKALQEKTKNPVAYDMQRDFYNIISMEFILKVHPILTQSQTGALSPDISL